MKEFKVGERVTITLEAIEQEDCKGCFFKENRCMVPYGSKCCHEGRSDGKSIIFKEVKE